MRVRSALAFATHLFFRQRGFQYVHTPIISAADCEGAGEVFQVSLAPHPLAVVKLDTSSIVCPKHCPFEARWRKASFAS